jgi:hypothetical protein
MMRKKKEEEEGGGQTGYSQINLSQDAEKASPRYLPLSTSNFLFRRLPYKGQNSKQLKTQNTSRINSLYFLLPATSDGPEARS